MSMIPSEADSVASVQTAKESFYRIEFVLENAEALVGKRKLLSDLHLFVRVCVCMCAYRHLSFLVGNNLLVLSSLSFSFLQYNVPLSYDRPWRECMMMKAKHREWQNRQEGG